MVSIGSDPFRGTLDAVFRELKRTCGSVERQVGDIQRNAALWVAIKSGLRDSVTILGKPTGGIDKAQLEAAPYAGAVGFLAASGLIPTRQLGSAKSALTTIVSRKPATAERAGYAQDFVRYLGLILLAKAINDQAAIELLKAAFPTASLGQGLPALWFRHQAGISLGLTRSRFDIGTDDATPVELATAIAAREMDFQIAKESFPVLDFDRIDELFARQVCTGEFTPAADLPSMLVLIALEAALNRRFTGSQDPISLVRSLGVNFVSALERWPDGSASEPVWLIDSEASLQRLLYFQYRSVFPSTVFEDPQPKDGVRSTRPDFGIRALRLALEAKFVHRADQFGVTQQQIESDAAGFFPGNGRYDRMLVFVYDASRSTDRHAALEGRIKELPNVADAFVVSPPSRLCEVLSQAKKTSRPKPRTRK